MTRKDYVPDDDTTKAVWATTLQSAAVEADNMTGMDWGTTEASDVATAAGQIKNAVTAKDAARQAWMSAIAAQDTIIEAALAIIRPLVAEGKTKATATEAIQQALGVIGEEIEFNPETYVAVLRAVTATGGGDIQVKFSRANGELDAANLYVRKAGVISWTRVGAMQRSPFTHHIALANPEAPETWEVCVRGVVGNSEIGVMSDPKVVIVK